MRSYSLKKIIHITSWNKRISLKIVLIRSNLHQIKKAVVSIIWKVTLYTTEASEKRNLQLSYKAIAQCFQASCQPWTAFKVTNLLIRWEREDKVRTIPTSIIKIAPGDFRATRTKIKIPWNLLIRDRSRVLCKSIIFESNWLNWYIFNN